MKTVTENQTLKNSFDILNENLPKIIEKSEKRDFTQLIDSSKNLLKIISINEENNNDLIETYIEDMNIECNQMFDFITKTKITKNLKNLIMEVLLATIHINEIYGIEVVYIEDHDNGRYEGNIKEGKREGFGKYFYSNGEIYEGQFKNNLKNGKGKYLFFNKDIYEGDYKNGIIHGKGKYLYVEGDSYEGEYKNGHRDGQGTYIYSNGNRYEGGWKKGKKNGFGIYYYKD